MPYRAPLEEYRFLLDHVVDYAQIADTVRFCEASSDVVEAVLSEAGRLCEEVLDPLQRNGDTDPARLENGIVRTSKGFAEGYQAIANGGWVSTSASPEYGGMGLPLTVTTAVNEMMAGACLALQLNPLMTQGQIEALEHHASAQIKALYLPKLISGEWCGNDEFNRAASRVGCGALRSQAKDNGDGTYAVTGRKFIFLGGIMIFLKTCAIWFWRGYLMGPAAPKGFHYSSCLSSFRMRLGSPEWPIALK